MNIEQKKLFHRIERSGGVKAQEAKMFPAFFVTEIEQIQSITCLTIHFSLCMPFLLSTPPQDRDLRPEEMEGTDS